MARRDDAPARLRPALLAAQLLVVSACAVYDPRGSEPAAPITGAATRVVRVCGEAVEFDSAVPLLAATGLFAAVKRCDEPFDATDVRAQVFRPYFDGADGFVTSILMVLSAGVIPAVHCRPDLAFRFYRDGSAPPLEVVPARTTCVLYGWLPPLFVPLPAFHWGRAPQEEPAARALRAAILAAWPSVGDAARGSSASRQTRRGGEIGASSMATGGGEQVALASACVSPVIPCG
ncbi:MAG: hypothetical protein SF182_26370 [Deltaproteobacteria bacterium]|nr:hypothetical protein [Deltaproteobacteria bacterium]